MAKRMSIADLEKMGLVDMGNGVYAPKGSVKPNTVKRTIQRRINVPAELVAKQPVIETPNFTINSPVESFLTIDGVVAGLNGKDGLMRSHWTNIKKIKDLYCAIITQHMKEGKVRKHGGEVIINYVGYKSLLMDWDNFCASFKHIGDSLEKCGVILKDNPKIVRKFLPEQIKCKRSEQKVIVIISDYVPST
jgi:hypothetical protein